MFSDLAVFLPAFERAFSAFRIALSEVLSTALNISSADRCSSTAGPFCCSFASFFSLFASFRASFDGLLSLLSLLPAACSTIPTSPFVGTVSCVRGLVPGSLAKFFNLLASLRSSLEGLLPLSSPLPTASLETSSRLLFLDFLVWSCRSLDAALTGASIIAGMWALVWSEVVYNQRKGCG